MRGVRSFIPSRTHDFAALTSAPAVTLSTTPTLYVSLLGGAARPLAGTIAPSRSEPRATGCCLASAELAVGRSRGGAEMGRVLAGQAGPHRWERCGGLGRNMHSERPQRGNASVTGALIFFRSRFSGVSWSSQRSPLPHDRRPGRGGTRFPGVDSGACWSPKSRIGRSGERTDKPPTGHQARNAR
jgi:hypothetical protein